MRRLWPGTVVLTLLLSGCGSEAPPCRFADSPDLAPSAGCLVLEGNALLVVENHEGLLSVPGGSTRPGETATCTAHRETWEETGLDVRVEEHLAEFDTGFYLYRCQLDAVPAEISPPPRFEIRGAYFLAPDAFGSKPWRFPEQVSRLRELIQQR